MIVLNERSCYKLPGTSSIFLKLDIFNKTLFDILVQTSNTRYDDKLKEFEFPTNKLAFLINLLTKYDDVKFIPIKDSKKDQLTCAGHKFKIKPYSYQLEGIEYGLNHEGWLLLDDQGLGKTFQMICLAEILKKKENLSHCLIICGINGLKYNWESEISKFSNLSCRILGQYTNRRGKLRIKSVADRCKELKAGIKEFFVITNIETLQNKEFYEAYKSSRSKFDLVILDECHKAKNPSSKSARNLLKIKAKRCIGLTGTLVMNDPENAYLPLKWTKNVNSNYSDFKKMFNVYGGFGGVQVIGYKNLDILKNIISKCSLRRLKSEVLDLPDKNYSIDYVEMSKAQQDLYDQVEDGILAELNLLETKPTVLQEIVINTRLRQITACPSILSTDVASSAKLDRLEQLIEVITAQGDKAVVFNTFRGAVLEEQKRLAKYNPLVCTGSEDPSTINYNKQQFQDNPDNKVMLCTWQKMGIGHTLTAANYVIFVDTPWTDADFQQCADRIYRIGQNKKCFIITLITKGTYDERVQEILEKKECLSGYLIDNKETDKLNIFNE